MRETERFSSHFTLAVFSNYHFTHIMLFITLELNRCNQDQNLFLIKFLQPREGACDPRGLRRGGHGSKRVKAGS